MRIFRHHRYTERWAPARSIIGRRLLLHGLVAVIALAGVAALSAASAVPALANNPVNTGPSLTLRNGTLLPGQWFASGSHYAPGVAISIEVFDLTEGGKLVESQSSYLYTSIPSLVPYNPGGLFAAAGASEEVLVDPDVGYRTEAAHPLRCGHQYQAFTSDPTDGLVPSNVLSEPACS